MTKPIFIVKTSMGAEYMESLTDHLTNMMSDYHVLVVYNFDSSEDTFECLNCVGENLKDIDIKELLKLNSNKHDN